MEILASMPLMVRSLVRIGVIKDPWQQIGPQRLSPSSADKLLKKHG